MFKLDIPDFGYVKLKHIVMDYNGTLAVDGLLIAGVKERLLQLSKKMDLHIITADTFGLVSKQVSRMPCMLKVVSSEKQSEEKLQYLKAIGAEETAAIGNGRIDRLMLKEARIGIACILEEGGALETISAADMVVNNINDALDLFLNPLRLKASLRG
jgi:soluble P-type ATPase